MTLRSPRQQGFVPAGDSNVSANAASVSSTNKPSVAATTSTSTATSTIKSTTSSTRAAVTTPSPISTSVLTTSTTPLTTSTASTTSLTTTSAVLTTTTLALPTTATVRSVSTTSKSTTVASRTYNTAYSISSSTPSATAAASSSPAVGTIIGIIGGGLVGVVVLAAIIGYFFRRASRRKSDFDRNGFMRNSMAIADDDVNGWSNEKPVIGSKNALALARANSYLDGPSASPRPPTMIERRANQAAAASFQPGEVVNPVGGYYQDPQAGYYNNYNQHPYANGYDYNQQHGMDQHQQQQYAGAYVPPSQYQQSQLTRKPSVPRGHGVNANANAGTEQPQQHEGEQGEEFYAEPNAPGGGGRHESVTPFQQQQYNEITLALNSGSPAAVPLAAAATTDGPNLGRALSTSYASLNPQNPAKTYDVPENADRSGTPTDNNPQQTYFTPGATTTVGATAGEKVAAPQQAAHRVSVYDDEDAYGGI